MGGRFFWLRWSQAEGGSEKGRRLLVGWTGECFGARCQVPDARCEEGGSGGSCNGVLFIGGVSLGDTIASGLKGGEVNLDSWCQLRDVRSEVVVEVEMVFFLLVVCLDMRLLPQALKGEKWMWLFRRRKENNFF